MDPRLPRPKKSLGFLIFVFVAAAVLIWFQDTNFEEIDKVVRRKLGQFGILIVYAAALMSIFSADLSSRYNAERARVSEKISSNASRISLLEELIKDFPEKGFDRKLVSVRDEQAALIGENQNLNDESTVKLIANYGAVAFLVIGTLCQLIALD